VAYSRVNFTFTFTLYNRTVNISVADLKHGLSLKKCRSPLTIKSETTGKSEVNTTPYGSVIKVKVKVKGSVIKVKVKRSVIKVKVKRSVIKVKVKRSVIKVKVKRSVIKVKLKFTPEQATKSQRGSRSIILLFL